MLPPSGPAAACASGLVSLHNFLPLPPHLAVSSFHREVDLVLHTLQIHPLPD